MKTLARWIALLAVGAGAGALALAEDVQGSRDHPRLSRFAGSEIMGYDHRAFDEFVLPLGPQVRDQNDKIVLSKSQRLEGKLTRILYKTPAGKTTLEVYRNYERALTQAGFEILFSCFDRDCGSLFLYVPTFEKELYGYTLQGHYRDSRYLSAKLAGPDGEIYVALFAFEHTSPHTALEGRVLVQQDVVEIEAMEEGQVVVNAATMARKIAAAGSVSLYGIYFDTNQAAVKPGSRPTLEQIARLLADNPDLTLYVVGHTDGTGSYAHNLDLSRRRAEAVVQALVTGHGVAADRLTPKGVGLLAPVASNRTDAGRAKNRRVALVER